MIHDVDDLYFKDNKTIFSPELTKSVITQIIVNKNRLSKKIIDIKTAKKYYGHHSDIENKRRVYYDSQRKEIENPYASNKRIASNFLRLLVEEKQNYCLGKTFISKISDETGKQIDNDNEYVIEWNKFLKDSLYRISHNVIVDSINCGTGWVYVWIDNEGKLKLEIVPPEQIYPEWKNIEHTEIDRLVYHYYILEYNDIEPNVKEFAEYWDEEDRILFDVNNGYEESAIIKDENNNPIYNHMTDGNVGISWGRIPFVYFKSNIDEKPLLMYIKEYIDSYDELSSKSVDSLIDDLEPLLIFKGVSPDVKTLLEAREIAKMTRTISLDTDGDAHFVQAQTNITEYQNKLESLRKDIIKFGYGIDYEDARFGGNPNQLVIKSIYQNLDIYCDGLEVQFQNFINQLKYFFDKWIEFTGKGRFDEVSKYNILVNFDRMLLMNKSEQIDDLLKLSGTGISQRTLLENNPVIQDVENELSRIEEEKQVDLKEQFPLISQTAEED